MGLFPKSWKICAVKDKAPWLAGEWIFFHDCSGINFQNFIGHHKGSLWYGDMICSQGICQKFEKSCTLTNLVSHKSYAHVFVMLLSVFSKSTTSDWYCYFNQILQGYFTGIGTIIIPVTVKQHWRVWIKIYPHHNTIKHSKMWPSGYILVCTVQWSDTNVVIICQH